MSEKTFCKYCKKLIEESKYQMCDICIDLVLKENPITSNKENTTTEKRITIVPPRRRGQRRRPFRLGNAIPAITAAAVFGPFIIKMIQGQPVTADSLLKLWTTPPNFLDRLLEDY